VDIVYSYTGLEADVAILADGKQTSEYKYPPALALAASQASTIRAHKFRVFLFGRTVIKICKLNLPRYCCGYRVKPQHLASPQWHDWSVSTDGSRLLVTLNDREGVRLLLAA